MKILIGTPIHICKDYCMERWLENVSKLEYPADLFMIDSSVGLDYAEKVKKYCEKYGIKKYKLEHIEIPKFQPFAEKVGCSREIIRQEILKNDYDAWLSWEPVIIVPVNALEKIAGIMGKYGFLLEYPDMPDCWAQEGEWFKKQVLKGGGDYVEVYGIIGPIDHLNDK